MVIARNLCLKIVSITTLFKTKTTQALLFQLLPCLLSSTFTHSTLQVNSLPSGPPRIPFDTFSQIHYYNSLALLPFTILIELLENSYYVGDFYFYWTALV